MEPYMRPMDSVQPHHDGPEGSCNYLLINNKYLIFMVIPEINFFLLTNLNN